MFFRQQNYSNIAFANVPSEISSPELLPPRYSPYPPSIPPYYSTDKVDCLDDVDLSNFPITDTKNSPVKNWTWMQIIILVLSIYSTITSLAFVVIAFLKKPWHYSESTMIWISLIFAVLAKTIEISFVTVFVAFVGQVISQRATGIHESAGFHLSELQLKVWIMQPGSLFTKGTQLRIAGGSVLGVASVLVSAIALLYTSAADTLVSPKLQLSTQLMKLSGNVTSNFGDPNTQMRRCKDTLPDRYKLGINRTTTFNQELDGPNCDTFLSGIHAQHNFFNFLRRWSESSASNDSEIDSNGRFLPQTIVGGTQTTGQWISNTVENNVYNITMVMPHVGVLEAIKSTSALLPPNVQDFDRVGGFTVAVPAPIPAFNIVCSPLSYDQMKWFLKQGVDSTAREGIFDEHIIRIFNFDPNPYSTSDNLTTGTVEAPRFIILRPQDYIYLWEGNSHRDPSLYVLISNSAVPPSEDVYEGDANLQEEENYTLCRLQVPSLLECLISFSKESTTDSLTVNCPSTKVLESQHPTSKTSPQFFNYRDVMYVTRHNLRFIFKISQMSFQKAIYQFIANLGLPDSKAEILPSQPSVAEGFAISVAHFLTMSTIDAPLTLNEIYNSSQSMYESSDPENSEFNPRREIEATVTRNLYISGAKNNWEASLYVVLILALLLNLACLEYFILLSIKKDMIRDWTEPDELLALLLHPTTSKNTESISRKSR